MGVLFRTDGTDGLGRVQLLLTPHRAKCGLISGMMGAIRTKGCFGAKETFRGNFQKEL